MEQHYRPHNFASKGEVDMYGAKQPGAYNRNPNFAHNSKTQGSAFSDPPPSFGDTSNGQIQFNGSSARRPLGSS